MSEEIQRPMKTANGNLTTPKSRSNRHIATDEDVAASGLRCNEDSGDEITPSKKAIEEQAEEGRVDKVAFEEGINPAAAEEYINRGRTHD
jgi:hypothetical protein